MRHRKFRDLRIYACLLLSLASVLEAQQTTARFLLLQPSATSNAMGGVGTTLTGDAFSAYDNPAALAFSKSFTAVGSFVKPIPVFGDIAHSFIGISRPFGSTGAFAVSANLFWAGKQFVTSEDGGIRGITSEFDWVGKISYALPVRNNLALGLGISVVQRRVWEDIKDFRNQHSYEYKLTLPNRLGIMMDAGVFIQNLIPGLPSFSNREFTGSPLDPSHEAGLSLAVSLLNVGPELYSALEESTDPLPTKLMIGLAYSPIQVGILEFKLASDLEKQLHEPSTLDYVHLGGEAGVGGVLRLRAGYFADTFGPKNSYFTCGGGIRMRFLALNVARYTRALLPSWHFDGVLSLEL